MREISISTKLFLVAAGAFLLLGGCNLWSGLHQDGKESNASVLVADGKAALARGDYNNARNYFSLAIQNDRASSEARVGYVEADLKVRKFDLVNFISTLVQLSESSSGTMPQVLIDPADWGVTTPAELTALYTTLINVLDPIPQGRTHGPIQAGNPTVNLDAGFFYILRTAARAQTISTSFTVAQFQKGSPEAAALLAADPILAAVYAGLPESFYWITSGPTPAELVSLQADIDLGVARLRTASANSSAGVRETIDELIEMFQSLQVQIQGHL